MLSATGATTITTITISYHQQQKDGTLAGRVFARVGTDDDDDGSAHSITLKVQSFLVF